MPGAGFFLGSVVGDGAYFAKGAFSRGSQAIGAANMATLAGAAGGGIYGGTIGRDRGQSRLGGALTGAMGGAAMGRYGRAGMRGARRGYRSGHLRGMKGITGDISGGQRLGISAMRGMGNMGAQGRRDFNYMASLARRSYGNLGASLRGNLGVGSFGGGI